MYTDEDLEQAIEHGIFSRESVSEFRRLLGKEQENAVVDEENFRLIGGFNDIFVVIACLLLVFSSWTVLQDINEQLALLSVPLLYWLLAEFFVRRRRMALPAIVLLLGFAAGVFKLGLHLFTALDDSAMVAASALTVFATALHWWRFRVPITIAIGTLAVVVFVVTALLSVFPEQEQNWQAIVFVCGLLTFAFAMFWDASDRERITRRSDVAFWLHLLAAPMIVHPVFAALGVFEGSESAVAMAAVVLLYVLMTLVSIIIDRRAFMVSSLIYVLYAISSILEMYGAIGAALAVTGVCLGVILLLLSAFWHPVRTNLLGLLPAALRQYVPVLK